MVSQASFAARNAAVVDKEKVVGETISGGMDLNEFEGGDNGSVGGEAVEAEIEGGGGGVRERGEEVGVGAVAGGGLRPGGAPAEDDGGGECDVEGRRTGLGVVVVVDGECAEEEARRRRERRESVAVFLAVGRRRE